MLKSDCVSVFVGREVRQTALETEILWQQNEWTERDLMTEKDTQRKRMQGREKWDWVRILSFAEDAGDRTQGEPRNLKLLYCSEASGNKTKPLKELWHLNLKVKSMCLMTEIEQ